MFKKQEEETKGEIDRGIMGGMLSRRDSCIDSGDYRVEPSRVVHVTDLKWFGTMLVSNLARDVVCEGRYARRDDVRGVKSVHSSMCEDSRDCLRMLETYTFGV